MESLLPPELEAQLLAEQQIIKDRLDKKILIESNEARVKAYSDYLETRTQEHEKLLVAYTKPQDVSMYQILKPALYHSEHNINALKRAITSLNEDIKKLEGAE